MVQVYGIVGTKYFQTAVLFNVHVYSLIAKSILINEHLEQISLYTLQNAFSCTCMYFEVDGV